MSVPFSSYPFSLLLSMPSAGDDPSVRAVQGALCKIRSRAISACLVGFCARACWNMMQSMQRMLCSGTSHRPHKRTNRNAKTSTSSRKTSANTCACCSLKSVRGLPQTCSAASRPRLPPRVMGPKRPDAPPGAWQQRQTAALWTYRQQVEYLRRCGAEPPPPPPPFPGGPSGETSGAASSTSPWRPTPPPPREHGLLPPAELDTDPQAELTHMRYGGVLALGFATQRFAVITHGRPVVVHFMRSQVFTWQPCRVARVMIRCPQDTSSHVCNCSCVTCITGHVRFAA